MFEDIRSFFTTRPKRPASSLGAGASAEDDPAMPAFQKAWKDGALVEDLFGPSPFTLHGSVGRSGADNFRPDVAKVETFLGDAGYYKPLTGDGPSGWHNSNLDQAIRSFQKDKGLEVDGFLKPDGPTIGKIGGLLARFQKIDGAKAETLRRELHRASGEMLPYRLASLGEGFREPTEEKRIAAAPKPPFGSTQGADRWAAGNMADALLGKGDYAEAVTHFRGEIGRNRAEAMPYLATVHEIMGEKNPGLAARFATQMDKAGLTAEPEKKPETAPQPAKEAVKPSLPSPTNKPIDPQALYEQLGYQHDGSGDYRNAIKHPLDAIKANRAADAATEAAEKEYGKNNPALGNGDGDAFRHALWVYKMAKEIGDGAARAFGDAHERDGRPDGERLMDLYNNAIGRELAADPRNKDRTDEEVVREAIKAGKLQTRPFNTPGPMGGGLTYPPRR